MARLARQLARDGWPVLFVTGPASGGEPFRPAGVRVVEVGGSAPAPTAAPDGNAAPPRGRPVPLWRRAAREVAFVPDPQVYWIPAALRATLAALGGRRPAAVFASAPPFSIFLLGRRLARRTGAPLVLDYRDVWTTHPWWPIPAWRRPIERALERRAQRSAGLVIANHDRMRDLLASGRPGLADRILVLPNGYDPADWGPPVRPAWTPGVRFEIAYAGTFYSATRHDAGDREPLSVRRPAGLFRAVRRLLDEHRFDAGGVRLRFVGARPGTPDAAMVRACAEECGVAAHVEVLPRQPIARLAPLLRESHLLVNVVYYTEAQVTQKLYEYMHLEIPVLSLVRESAPNAALAERAGVGPVVDPADPDAIAAAIAALLDAYRAGRSPIRPDRAFIDQFDVRRQTALLGARLRALAAAQAPAAER
jgi:glycosyltransferase involved in cell wall biosynthesis